MPSTAASFWGCSGVSEPIIIDTDRGVLIWRPTAPHLIGDEPLVREVEARLALSPTVDVTPTGPTVEASAGVQLAVLGILERMGLTLFGIYGDTDAVELPPNAIA